MSTLHMDTENVRALANQMRANLQALQDNLQNLYNAANGLDWQGANRDQFSQELEQIVRTISTHFESGIQLSQRVQAEADEWERIASESGAAFSGIKTTGIAAAAGSIGAVGVAAVAGANVTTPGNPAPVTAPSAPLPLSSGHVTAVPPYAFAVFSQLAYQDDVTTAKLPEQLQKQGWEVLTSSGNVKKGGYFGYFGVAYYNKHTNELVFAHRGTQFTDLGDLISDANFTSGRYPVQYLTNNFVEDIQMQLRSQGISNPTIVHTGHSLGGVLADLHAFAYNTKSITFENPGAERVLSTGDIHPNRENFIAYQSNPNIFHLMGENVGYTSQIVPQDGGYLPTDTENLKKTFLKSLSPNQAIKELAQSFIKFNETCHSMDNIVNSIDPNTGYPRLFFPAEMQGHSHGVFDLENQEAAKQRGAINAPYTPARKP